MQALGSLSNDVFERRMPNGSGLFAILVSDVAQNFRPNLPYERKRHSRKEIWQRQSILKWKMPHFRLTCVAQKRLCFNSQLSPAEFTAQFARKVCSSSGAQIFGAQIVHTKEFGGRLPLSSTKCFFFIIIITPLPFLLCLNSVISLLPRRLCNSRTKVGSCLLFIHSILCTYHCKAGGGGWRKAGHGVGI